MRCYKCHSTENLSVKKTDKHGNMTFMCKACRSEEYYRRVPQKALRHNHINEFDVASWTEMALERHKRLADKYRPCDAFLRSKGLL